MTKVIPRKELFGKKQTDAKAAYMRNLNEMKVLKKEFFKVKIRILSLIKFVVKSTGSTDVNCHDAHRRL